MASTIQLHAAPVTVQEVQQAAHAPCEHRAGGRGPILLWRRGLHSKLQCCRCDGPFALHSIKSHVLKMSAVKQQLPPQPGGRGGARKLLFSRVWVCE